MRMREAVFLSSLSKILRYCDKTIQLWVYPSHMMYCIPISHGEEKEELGPLIKIVKKEREIEIHFERVIPKEELGERRIEPRELK